MCGLVGIVGSVSLDILGRMMSAIHHRGPDGSGTFFDPKHPLALGHLRLSILDTSDAGTQPMTSACGRYTLIYNGECYNFADLRQTLEGRGAAFRSGSDTEVVLEWLVAEGAEGLGALNGMFALALWDRIAGQLLLARDSFGIKPLYYYAPQGGPFLFASELRALVASGLCPSKVDRVSVAHYLSYGVTLEPRTILEDVRMLAPGTWIRLRADDLAVSHGTFSAEAPGEAGAPVTNDEMHGAFIEAVKRQLVSDVPVGAFLSGGIDSTAIVAAMTRKRGFDVKTLTVAFPDAPTLDESARARSWAEACGADHTEIPMSTADILDALPRALAAQDQPTLDAVNTFVVSEAAAAAGLTVVLSGLGGDELFGGYATTRDVPRMLRMRKRFGVLGRSAAPVIQAITPSANRRLSKIVDLLEAPRTVAGLYLARRRIHSPRQLRRLCPGLVLGHGSELPNLTPPAASDVLDEISWLESVFYMRNQLLRDSDAMGMACSIEIRVPFLEHDFARLAWRAGPGWRDGKQRFGRAAHDLLPPDALTRKKQGFTFPFEQWLCGPLREQVEERLGAAPAIFSRQRLLDMWRRFQKDPGRVGWTRPWAIYVLLEYLERHGLSV